MYSPIAFFDDNFDFEQQRLAAAAAAAQQYSRELQGAAEPPAAGSIPPAIPLDSPQQPAKLMAQLPPLPPMPQLQPASSKKRPRPAPARPVVADDDDSATNNNDDDDEYDGTEHDAKKRPASKKKKAAAGSGGGGAAAAGGVPRSRNATSMYRGVSRCSKDGRWQARIRCVPGATGG